MKCKDWIQQNYKKKIGKRCIAVLVGSVILSILIGIIDTQNALPQNKNGDSIIYRGDYGAGDTNNELRAQIDGRKESEEIAVTLKEREYSPDKIEEILSSVGENIEPYILKDNKSLDQVQTDLNLITKIPDTSIEVEWEVSDYKIMDATGEIHQENVDAGGEMLTLTAVLSYHQMHVVQEIPVCIYPPILSEQQAVNKMLEDAVQKSQDDSKSETEVILPSEVDGNHVKWSQKKETRWYFVMGIGILICILLVLSDKEKLKQDIKKRKTQMILDYPNIMNQFLVLLSAGLTAKNAWARMVEQYEGKRKSGSREQSKRYAYEEMSHSLREMQSGRTESECYERFGSRCGIQEYRKFGAILSQNLKKGSKGLMNILRQEAENAFEERKNNAKKLGEEASTKLLLPMMLMLIVVFIIMIVPAFLSIQL